jgi:hypothetical protein
VVENGKDHVKGRPKAVQESIMKDIYYLPLRMSFKSSFRKPILSGRMMNLAFLNTSLINGIQRTALTLER